ncbi:hypothetical protein N431DRAFT_557493 [Stipitochalara longipes BDJ]|nr:hypothetical protein N431DRAFT_557493 [Stipitochalara longipes BDJ]
MVAFTNIISAISMALVASTANAAPSAKRDNPAIDFTLYAPPTTNQTQCWNNVKGGEVHLRTAALTNGVSACNTINFSTFEIYTQHGLNCRVNVFDNPTCKYGNIGSYDQVGVCEYASTGSNGTLKTIQLQSWQVTCDSA